MGLPDHYQLLSNYNEAYRLTGTGIVVPIGYLARIASVCASADAAFYGITRSVRFWGMRLGVRVPGPRTSSLCCPRLHSQYVERAR